MLDFIQNFIYLTSMLDPQVYLLDFGLGWLLQDSSLYAFTVFSFSKYPAV